MTRHCQSAAEKDPIFTYRDFEAFQVEFRRTTHVRVEIVVVKHVPNLRRTCGKPPDFRPLETLWILTFPFFVSLLVRRCANNCNAPAGESAIPSFSRRQAEMNPWVSLPHHPYGTTFPALAMDGDDIGGILSQPLLALRHDGEYLRYVGSGGKSDGWSRDCGPRCNSGCFARRSS